MSRQYNPAESAYLRMDLDGFNKLDKVEEPDKSGLACSFIYAEERG